MTIIRLYPSIDQVRTTKMVFFAERLEAAFPIQIILYDFFLEVLLAFEDANAAGPSILYKLIHFRIAVEETPARLAASRPRIRPARHSSMSQILNSGSISFRLLILILSLFQCLCYREHIILPTSRPMLLPKEPLSRWQSVWRSKTSAMAYPFTCSILR